MSLFEKIDILSTADGVAGRLSNFTKREFIIDGVPCRSMEGFIQSLKFIDEAKQRETCMLWGVKAKKRGMNRDDWKKHQVITWKGQRIARNSIFYQELIDKAFACMARANPDFQKDLLETGDVELVHSIGKTDPRQTLLTEKEFVSRLMELRTVFMMMLADATKEVVEENGGKVVYN